MKKLYFLLILSLFFARVNAQWVTIPDPNFTAFLQQQYPQCMNGNQMDTTCSAIVNESLVNCNSKNISDLTGIEYFDNLLQLHCSNNTLTNLPLLPNGLQTLYCETNQLSVLPNLPSLLIELNCNYNQLTSLPNLPNSLVHLMCHHNQLTSLPPLPSNLYSLFAQNNQLTSIPLLNSDLFDLDVSNNNISGIILSLPDNLAGFYCSNNQITSILSLNNSLGVLDCSNNFITSLPTLPFTLYSLNCSNNPLLSCLPLIHNLNWLNFTNTNIQCMPNYGNVMSSQPSIFTVPLCEPINVNNCPVYWNISGKIYNDSNQNCIIDPNETALTNVKVNLYKSGVLEQHTITNEFGYYSFITDTGTFMWSIDTSNSPLLIVCPNTGYHNAAITTQNPTIGNQNFGLICQSGIDLGVNNIISTSGQFFPASYATIKTGAGDLANFYGLHCATGVSGTVTIDINGPVTYISEAPGALIPQVSGNSILTYSISDFGTVNFNSDFQFIIQTDTLAQAGNVVCITVNVTPTSGDNDTTNNSLQHCFTVVNSFDPNDKQVSPSNVLLPDHEWLTYTIRFQNTGTAPAQQIYILDTLDQNLDVSSFTFLSYSHDNLTQVLGDVVKFNFPNINLPDSTNDEPNSHGFVQYKIKLKPNLPIGTVISNTAYNFFDFNLPVATNTVVNQIYFLNPTIAPNNLILCPNESDTLWTQVYDSYQWYKDGVLIAGATQQYLVVDYFNDSGSQFMVEVDSAGVIAQSAPVLVDGWAFLPPFVISEGTFAVGPNGEMFVCPGDTAYLILGSPYDTNIQWTESGNIIPGANNDTLVVTQSGNYHVSAAPSTCPNFIQNLGVMIEVIVQGPPEPVITVDMTGTILETAPGFVLYEWFHEGNAIGINSNTIPVQGGGMYTVIVSDANGCTSESQPIVISAIIGNLISGIININFNSQTSTLHITRTETKTETEIFVSDVLGRVVADKKMQKGISEIELKFNHIKPGIYFVNLSDGGSVKFFVE